MTGAHDDGGFSRFRRKWFWQSGFGRKGLILREFDVGKGCPPAAAPQPPTAAAGKGAPPNPRRGAPLSAMSAIPSAFGPGAAPSRSSCRTRTLPNLAPGSQSDKRFDPSQPSSNMCPTTVWRRFALGAPTGGVADVRAGVLDVDLRPLLVAPRVSVPTIKHIRDVALEVLERDVVGNVAVAGRPAARPSARTTRTAPRAPREPDWSHDGREDDAREDHAAQ
jgi:hypothetical protein